MVKKKTAKKPPAKKPAPIDPGKTPSIPTSETPPKDRDRDAASQIGRVDKPAPVPGGPKIFIPGDPDPTALWIINGLNDSIGRRWPRWKLESDEVNSLAVVGPALYDKYLENRLENSLEFAAGATVFRIVAARIKLPSWDDIKSAVGIAPAVEKGNDDKNEG